jgi:hypothetical protein
MTDDHPSARAITFISHFRVRPGHLEAFEALWSSVSGALEASRPATVAFLGYLTDDRRTLTIVHVFPDDEALAAHFEGADDRAAVAYEHLEPAGWEIYGRPNDRNLAELQAASDHTGAPLTVHPAALGGFLRAAAR